MDRRRSTPGGARGAVTRAAIALGLIAAMCGVAHEPASAIDIIDVASSNGRFANALGIAGIAPPCLAYTPDPQSDQSGALNQVRFGQPPNAGGCGSLDQRSGFGFQGVEAAATFGTVFELGRFTHFNNPVLSSNDKVGTVDLQMSFEFADRRDGSAIPFESTYRVTLDETPNNSNPCPFPDGPNEAGCADRVSITQPEPVTATIGETTFTIEIGGYGTLDADGNCDFDQRVTGESVLTPEGGATTFCIYGQATASQLVIDKHTIGGDGTFTFRYEELSQLGPVPVPTDPPRVSTATVTTDDGTGTTGPIEVEPGLYRLDEIDLPDGVHPGDLTCSSSDGSAWVTIDGVDYLDLDSAVTVTCELTNTFDASITVVKQAGPSSAQDFTFTTTGGSGLPSTLVLDDDGDAELADTVTHLVAAGDYTVTEATTDDWRLADLSCVLDDQPGDTASAETSGATAALHLGPGDHAVCTYTNQATARLLIAKQWVDAVPGEQVSVTATLDAGATPARRLDSTADAPSEIDEHPDPLTFDLGAIATLAEIEPPAGYTSSLACEGRDDAGAAAIGSVDGATLTTLSDPAAIGGTILCTFTNVRIVPGGAITIVKVDDVADAASVAPGGTYRYTLQVINSGTETILPGATVTDDLPAPLSLVGASGDDWSCPAVDPLVCTYGPALAPGAAASPITVEVSVAASASAGTIHNVADVTGRADHACSPAAPTCNQVDDRDDEDTPVVVPRGPARADMAIVKSVSAPVVAPGGEVTWRLDVTNLGPDAADGISVADRMPADLTVIAVESTEFTCSHDGNDIACTRPTMGANERGSIEIVTTVSVAADGDIVNVATVDSETPDPNRANNRDDATVTVVRQLPPPTSAPPTTAPPTAPPRIPQGPLPRTGAEIGVLIAAAMIVVLLGAATWLAARGGPARPRDVTR